MQLMKRTSPSRLHLIDPWLCMEGSEYVSSNYGRVQVDQGEMDHRYQMVLAKLEAYIRAGTVCVHRATSQEAAGEFEDGYFDYVYIDGDHTHAMVAADLAAYFPKVRTGGLIIGDDYMLGRWWGDGVVRAFHEFLYRFDVVVELKLEHQIVLRKLDPGWRSPSAAPGGPVSPE